jgi:succinate dehydrogenase / fumarate reductase membrane anchor subunit
LLQRLSAIYIALFTLFIAGYFLVSGTPGYTEWRAFVHQPFIKVLWALFFLSLFGHAWVGLRDVVMDYVHVLAVRVTALAVLILVLIGLGAWSLQVLLAA